MSSTALLGTYLNDHLGGANAGVEMVHRLHKKAGNGPDAAVLGPLAEDIEQDRDDLRALVDALGESGHPVKEAVGWIAGKAQRLALGEVLTGDEDLTLLLEYETLALGIDGKLALWQALLAVAAANPQLHGDDLARLADRARDQRSRIEAVRLDAARRAFVTAG